MRWVPTYPEAQAQADRYAAVMRTLNTNKSNIETEVGISGALMAADFEAANLSGEAYAEYVMRRDNWFGQKERAERMFGAFVTDLQVCIDQAGVHEGVWRSRIGIGVWVDD